MRRTALGTDPEAEARAARATEVPLRFQRRPPKTVDREHSVIRLPPYERVAEDPILYAHASRILHQESNPGNARALVQRHGDTDVWLNTDGNLLTAERLGNGLRQRGFS